MQTSYTLEWLELPLIIRATMAPVADVILVSDAEVTVDYCYEPAQREYIRADPNDSQPGFPDSVEVYKVTAAEPIILDNEGISVTLAAGFDLTGLLSRGEICTIEHDLVMGIRKHRRAA